MLFRTELQPSPPPFRLSLRNPLLSVGSCFADVIGQQLVSSKFKALVNPFGTLFHPLPAARLLHMALSDERPPAESYLQFQERWLNYLLHSSINAQSHVALQEKVEELLTSTKKQLLQGQALMLTLGTSFLYELQEPSLSVANCHKQPQKHFVKRLVPAEETLGALISLWQQLKGQNQDLKLILTVSPVRHLKDSLELNSISKALLRVVCHQLASAYPEDIYYFPSYELLMDDLRDYRYYAPDLLHPSPVAEQYVWEKFATTLLDDEAQAFLKVWVPLQQALSHRPFNRTSAAHQQFIKNTLQKLSALSYPVDVASEIKMLREQITHD